MSTNKFEEMLERLINEDKEGAEELFHEIVVEKSREIYEGLLEDEEVEETTDEEVDESEEEVDESDEDLDEAADEEVDESDEDLDEATDEEVDESDEDLDEFMDEPVAMEADPTDELEKELGDMGDEEPGDEGDAPEGAEAALDDLEAALDALKDEFAAMMGDDKGDDEGDDEGDMDMDMDMDKPEEEAYAFEADKDEDEEDEVEESKQPKSAAEEMREYVEKIGGDQYPGFGKMGDNGANSKSVVAGKNDMGGTTANIAQGKDNEAGDHAGLGDLNAKDETAGNVNVPGGKAAKAGKTEPGHGAEKKGAAPSKADADSPLNGDSRRAK